MNCPQCNIEMSRGQATVHGTAAGFLVHGFSYQHCWFEEYEKNAGEQVIVESNGRKDAFRCPKCKSVLILNDDLKQDEKSPYLVSGSENDQSAI